MLTGVLFSATQVMGAGNWPPPDVNAYDWQPQPDKAALMVVAAHPDDEGIFFGGAIPYYAAGRNLPTVLISATNGDGGQNHLTPYPDDIVGEAWGTSDLRVGELMEAAWGYGLRNKPIVGPVLADHFNVHDLTPFMVQQIRLYRPDVIITHDPVNGEYGHGDHVYTGLAVISAFMQAANPNIVVYDDEGNELAPWQPLKLFVHLHPHNTMTHTWEEPLEAFEGLSSREVVDEAMRAHRSQSTGYWQWETDLGGDDNKPGAPPSPTVRWAPHDWSSELWGLYAWADGYRIVADNDFFAGIDTTQYLPEPMSLSLLGIGAVLMLRRRR